MIMFRAGDMPQARKIRIFGRLFYYLDDRGNRKLNKFGETVTKEILSSPSIKESAQQHCCLELKNTCEFPPPPACPVETDV